jgi:hypothetical protein
MIWLALAVLGFLATPTIVARLTREFLAGLLTRAVLIVGGAAFTWLWYAT